MSGRSFRKIDYSIRPAKHTERKMLCEIFRRLWPFQAIEDYTYVGMGSVWFSDFVLFHRMLGIKSMISIEQSGQQERFTSNKPFAAIQMRFGQTGAELPKLDWSKNYFLWIDYDDPLTPSMLLDIGTVATNATSGTVLAISVQCHQAQEVAFTTQYREGPSAKDCFITSFGIARVPTTTADEDLYGWPFGKLSRTMVLSEIQASLATRNVGQSSDRKVSFSPICTIEYEDGAKMTTIVGIFIKGADASKLEECRFQDLDFFPEGSRHVRIAIPKLTVAEIRGLERQLPASPEELILGAIPPAEAKHFSELYRYLPNFAVLEG
ncbi:MAG: hypothetical protein HQL40_12305 [Alphaproteobacteria bacterium]|nr:hypothetical protein [Alphaproteobacteria bacterium]